ncbi:MAG: hypothetical protein JOZ24_09545 [Candidatus Eremiobacteraeota bacterium]|nr:hypothetical protein [Candidatus Eremiobacteraeota bacterium]
MNDSSKTTSGELPTNQQDAAPSEAGKTLLVGVLGGLISAAAYQVYQRLPDEQKDRLHRQVRSALEQRITELRNNFNI